MTHFKLGWLPDLPDERDFLFAKSPMKAGVIAKGIPTETYLKCPVAWQQGNLGSCTIHAGGMGVLVLSMAQKAGAVEYGVISRLQGYYEIRKLLGPQYVSVDSGGFLRHTVKVLASGTIGPEILWDYQIQRFAAVPPQEVYLAGIRHPLTGYSRVAGVDECRVAIAGGSPVIFGFTVRRGQLEKAWSSGVLDPMRGAASVGGHAVAVIGYSDARSQFLIRNSHGKDFGTTIPGQENLGKGNFWAHYDWFDGGDVDDRWALENWKE